MSAQEITPREPPTELTLYYPDATDEQLWTIRDAGRYAALLCALQPEETRLEWRRIVTVDLTAAATYRERRRNFTRRFVLDPDSAARHTEYTKEYIAKRSFLQYLDTPTGRWYLVDQIAQRAASIPAEDLPDLRILAAMGPQAEQQLARNNTALVFYTAKLPGTGSYATASKLGNGYEGLVRAVQAYDPNDGITFSTYAVRNIGGFMLKGASDYLATRAGTKRGTLQRATQLNRQAAQLTLTLHRAPTDKELSQYTGLRVDTIRRYREITDRLASLSLHDRDVHNRERLETLSDTQATRLFESDETDPNKEQDLRTFFKTLFDTLDLSGREQSILYGLNGIPPYSHAVPEIELSAQLGLTVGKLRLIHMELCQKLYSSPQAHDLLKQFHARNQQRHSTMD